MEVSGQLSTPAALPPEKESPVSTGHEAGWAPEPVRTTWKREFLAPVVAWIVPVIGELHDNYCNAYAVWQRRSERGGSAAAGL
jgi:hypothetical protein